RGFYTFIRDITWNPVVPMEFVTGCDVGSVRVWRMSRGDAGEAFVANMIWDSNISNLCTDGLVPKDATDLTPIEYKLLIQRGAVDDILVPEKMEGAIRCPLMEMDQGCSQTEMDGMLGGRWWISRTMIQKKQNNKLYLKQLV
ncbi:hypothetical protein BG015_004998, partial [Linnemannia schmuckeri]